MGFEPFSMDISLDPAGEPTSLMVHIRAETADKWRTNLRAAADINPAIARVLAALGGIGAPMAERIAVNDREVAREQHDQVRATAAPTPIKPAGAAAVGPTAFPVCATHGKSKISKFGDGLYCPSKNGDTYCKWAHECTANCNHAAAA